MLYCKSYALYLRSRYHECCTGDRLNGSTFPRLSLRLSPSQQRPPLSPPLTIAITTTTTTTGCMVWVSPMQNMRPRRAHTKSRNGCDQCKKRRVKCDERGPPCSNCTTRDLECTYLKTPQARTTSQSSASPANGHPPSAVGSGPLLSPFPVSAASLSTFSNLRNLELMHKFSTETYQSLSNDPSDYHVWQILVPKRSLEYDFLLNGVLAVAALHTATSIEPPAALSYIDAALEYHNMAFAPFRHALDHIAPSNCDAVFAHSIITTVIGIALPRLTSTRDEGSSMTENIVVVFELLQGVKNIIWISEPWLKTKLFTPRREFWKAAVSELDHDTDAALNKLVALNDDKMADLDPEQHRINSDAITLLRRCFSRHANALDAASVLTWLAAVDKDFVDCLRRRKPFPLLILMHWGVLLGTLDGQMWWARNSGKALVTELLRPGVFQWEGAELWPKQKMGL